jgi:DNA ligase (NAD+)
MNEIEQLVARLETCNRAYRDGKPLISDAEYDRLVEKLRVLDPRHVYLQTVEPEKFSERVEIRHPEPMLSTEKAYTAEQLQRYLQRVQKSADAMNLETLQFLVLPKLDGLAGRDDGEHFASRGNGIVGFEISSAFEKGVVPIGGRGNGLGEIVVVQSYFDAHMSDKFEHPRNMVVGIVSSDKLNEDARQALQDGMVHFVPYNQLPSWQGDGNTLLAKMDEISDQLAKRIDYPMDGVVVEVVDHRLKAGMGATAHHHRWQIAVKRKGDTAETTVESIRWQVGRTGNVTPVMAVEPISLSGATIRRVTAHHAGMVEKLRLGPGARIEVIRSGEVIPKLERLMLPSDEVVLPDRCPSCESPLQWRGDFLRCTYLHCPAQIEQRICHWFRTLGSADWFGIKTVQKLVTAGYDTLERIYALTVDDFEQIGFGPVQSQNLADALVTSRTKAVEDWRFLAAFGIPDLGVGDSRRLLEHIGLDQLLEVTSERIAAINGFGEVTSRSISQGVSAQHHTISNMLSLGFHLIPTPLSSETTAAASPVAGKKIVFTGKMKGGSRSEMQHRARQLGAAVQASVSGATDLLVCGERVGTSKLEKASKLGVEIISEADYYLMIDNEG